MLLVCGRTFFILSAENHVFEVLRPMIWSNSFERKIVSLLFRALCFFLNTHLLFLFHNNHITYDSNIQVNWLISTRIQHFLGIGWFLGLLVLRAWYYKLMILLLLKEIYNTMGWDKISIIHLMKHTCYRCFLFISSSNLIILDCQQHNTTIFEKLDFCWFTSRNSTTFEGWNQ